MGIKPSLRGKISEAGKLLMPDAPGNAVKCDGFTRHGPVEIAVNGQALLCWVEHFVGNGFQIRTVGRFGGIFRRFARMTAKEAVVVPEADLIALIERAEVVGDDIAGAMVGNVSVRRVQRPRTLLPEGDPVFVADTGVLRHGAVFTFR